MKTNHIYLLLLLLFDLGCKQNVLPPNKEITPHQAATLYHSQLRSFSNKTAFKLVDSLPSNPDWTHNYTKSVSGETCLVIDLPIVPGRSIQTATSSSPSPIAQSLIFRRKKDGELYFQLLLSWANGNSNNGISMMVIDQNGQFKGSFLSEGNQSKPTQTTFNRVDLSMARGRMYCTQTDVYTCVYYNGQNVGCNYNYSTFQCAEPPGDDGGGGYTGYDPDSGGASGGGKGGGFNYNELQGLRTKVLVRPPLNKIISNFPQHMQCFSTNTAASYEVTLYVKQPIPLTRLLVSDQYGNYVPNSFDPDKQFSVGHTFLGFTQSGGGKATVTRTVGFYPGQSVTPFTPETKGVIADNSVSDYDVAVTLKVTPAQFKAIMDDFYNRSQSNYNLNWNNCTSIAIDALKAGGQNVPKTMGQWPLGKGADPADLGEDLRVFNSSAVKAKNTSRGTSAPNTSSCQ